MSAPAAISQRTGKALALQIRGRMVHEDDELPAMHDPEDRPVVEPLTEADEEELAEAEREGRLGGVQPTDDEIVDEEEDEELGPPAA